MFSQGPELQSQTATLLQQHQAKLAELTKLDVGNDPDGNRTRRVELNSLADEINDREDAVALKWVSAQGAGTNDPRQVLVAWDQTHHELALVTPCVAGLIPPCPLSEATLTGGMGDREVVAITFDTGWTPEGCFVRRGRTPAEVIGAIFGSIDRALSHLMADYEQFGFSRTRLQTSKKFAASVWRAELGSTPGFTMLTACYVRGIRNPAVLGPLRGAYTLSQPGPDMLSVRVRERQGEAVALAVASRLAAAGGLRDS